LKSSSFTSSERKTTKCIISTPVKISKQTTKNSGRKACLCTGVEVGLPVDRYFTGLVGVLLQIWQWPVFLKSVPAAGILKMNVCSNCKKTNAEDVDLRN